MSDDATINLATVGTAELEGMSTQVFAGCLDTMSGDAIERFKRMRKLSANHRSALEKYLVEHPEKRPGGESYAAAAPAKAAKPAPAVKPAKTKAPIKAVTSGKAKRPSPFLVLKRLLRAWWVGVAEKDLDAYDKNSGKTASNAVPAAPAAKAAPAVVSKPAMMEISRAEMLQMLWGEGFSLPGGEAFTEKLLNGVSVPEGYPCLDITAGLGGGTSVAANLHKTIVEGIEADPHLAEAAKTRAANEHAPIVCGDPTIQSFADKTYGAIFARETLFTVPDRKKLLANLVPSLRPLGTIVLTDFMLTDRKTGSPEMKAWRETEPVRALPYTIEEYTELLDLNKFSVRGCDDLSTEYIDFIQAGWKRLHACLQTAKFSPETAAMLMAEGDVWLARCRALESGQLRLISIKGALKPVRSMSDAMKVPA